MACVFYFASCMNIIFNSLLAQLVKYDIHTTCKIKSIHAIFITYYYFIAVEEIRFTKELEDVKLDKVNVDVCLECELSKDGQKVEWFKDSKKLRPDLEHDIQDEGKIHRLIIKKATPKDIGTYRADYMHLSTSAKLSIEGR